MTDHRTETMTRSSALTRVDGVVALIRDWIGFAWSRGLERVLLWHDRASARRQLNGMDAHMLKDIGVTRAEVDAECQKRFWRP